MEGERRRGAFWRRFAPLARWNPGSHLLLLEGTPYAGCKAISRLLLVLRAPLDQ